MAVVAIFIIVVSSWLYLYSTFWVEEEGKELVLEKNSIQKARLKAIIHVLETLF